MLCCPLCRGALVLQELKCASGEIEEGALSCPSCSKRYTISNFIPRFVTTDAYTKSFSLQWNMYKRTQLDSASGRDDSRRMFVERMGIQPEQLKDKTVLDIGCGMGRLMEVAAPFAKTSSGSICRTPLTMRTRTCADSRTLTLSRPTYSACRLKKGRSTLYTAWECYTIPWIPGRHF